MPEEHTAKLFKNGRSQAVRLPKAFRFGGDRVRVRRFGGGVLLEPLLSDVDEWFEQLDRFDAGPFSSEERDQPEAPPREMFG